MLSTYFSLIILIVSIILFYLLFIAIKINKEINENKKFFFGSKHPPNYAKFSGQLGNNIYQYLHSRFYSLLKGVDFYSLKLDEPFRSALTNVTACENIKDYRSHKETIHWNEFVEENGIVTEYPFNCSLIFKNLDLVKQWLNLKEIEIKYSDVKQKMKNSISLHVRIGDSLKVQKIMPFPTLQYWRKAVTTALYNLGNDPSLNISIVTKYPHHELTREISAMLKIHFPTRNIEIISNSIQKEIDFVSLLFSRGIILCSSTFSLWASFLSETAEVVCYPSYTHPEQNYNLYAHILPTQEDINNAKNVSKIISKWVEMKDDFVVIPINNPENIEWCS